MRDHIFGEVTSIQSGHTFEMAVVHQDPRNGDSYGALETVRLAGSDAPCPDEPGGSTALENLRRRLVGKKVHVRVHQRNGERQLVGTVRPLPRNK